MLRFAIVLLSLLAWVCAPAQACAQEDRARATPLFEEGVEHAQAGEWEQARTRFEEAFALYSHPNIQLNLAAAQAETGHLTDSLATYEALLEALNAIPARRRRRRRLPELETVEEARDDVRDRIPRLTVRVAGAEPGDVVRVDDEARDLERLADIPLDPGEHAVAWVRDGRVVGRAEVTLVDGDERAVEVAEAEADAPPPVVDETPGQTPWIPLGIAALAFGGVAVGVAGGFMGLVDGLGGDPALTEYRTALPLDAQACSEAEAGTSHGVSGETLSAVQGVCSDAGVFEPMQYVFLLTGLAAIGVGVTFVLLEVTSDDDAEPSEVRARVSPGRITLDWAGSF
ncbi:MAG: hypothetical protein AB8I08_28390 [Sandaracinaceae bacterium]